MGLARLLGRSAKRADRRIKRDIIRCVLPPASEVTEGDLCDRYTLGKASVRTALARLGQEGLLKAMPRRGHVIAPITLGDVSDVFDLRMILEPAAIRLAIERADDAVLKSLVDLSLPGEQPHRESGDFVSANLQINRRFHVRIAEASGSQRLVTLTAQLLDAVERVFYLWISIQPSVDQKLDTEYREHADIARALSQRNTDLACQLAKQWSGEQWNGYGFCVTNPRFINTWTPLFGARGLIIPLNADRSVSIFRII